MGDKTLIPWREVASWQCRACGNCCIGYRVPLRMDEFVKVGSACGQGVFEYGTGKVYLKNGPDRRCVLQRPLMDTWICTIQGMKPTACRLFPFRIQHKPVYLRGDNSDYKLGDKIYYIYLDPDCEGIVPGQPTERFANQVLPEIIRSGFGVSQKQRYTTSRYISWTPP
jgi:Fe-S-cluster containining protein